MRERVDLKSPVREYRPPGSVRGALGNRRPYLDSAINLVPAAVPSDWVHFSVPLLSQSEHLVDDFDGNAADGEFGRWA